MSMIKRSSVLVVVLAVLVVCASAAMAAGRFGKPSPSADLAVGAELPDFTLRDLENREVSLHQWRGKLVALTFWASWCPACRSELPSLEALHSRLKGEGIEVLGVNGGESPERIRSFVSKVKLSFPVLLDKGGEVHALYQVRQYPVTFIIDRQGRLLERHIGARDWSSAQVLAHLRALATNEVEGAQ